MKNLTALILTLFVQITLLGNHGQYAFLGVRSNQVQEDKAIKLNFDRAHGAYLTRIIPNTAAEKAGLQVFDYIYQIGDYDLSEEWSLGKIMRQYEPDDEVVIHLVRNGKYQQVAATLGSNWDNVGYHRPDEEDPFLGVYEKHETSNQIEGVAVTVSSNTTAEEIGMQDDDIIVSIDDVPMIDWHDVIAGINNRSAGDNIKVTVWREGKYLTFNGPIKPESSRHHSDWSWDWSWDWKWTWDQNRKHNADNMDLSDMDVEVEMMPTEEVEDVMVETGLDMPVVNNLSIEEVQVFPNPSMGMFTLRFDLPSLGMTQVRIFSSTGQLVFTRDLGAFSGTFTENLDIVGAGPGIYYLMLQQNDLAITRKLVVSAN